MKERLKEFRKFKKLTQQAMAETMNVSKSTIEAYEYGRVEIPQRFIDLLAHHYDVNEDWLKSGTGPMFIEHDISDNVSDAIVSLYKRTDISENAKEKLAGILKVAANMSENQINVLIELGHELARLEKENLPE